MYRYCFICLFLFCMQVGAGQCKETLSDKSNQMKDSLNTHTPDLNMAIELQFNGVDFGFDFKEFFLLNSSTNWGGYQQEQDTVHSDPNTSGIYSNAVSFEHVRVQGSALAKIKLFSNDDALIFNGVVDSAKSYKISKGVSPAYSDSGYYHDDIMEVHVKDEQTSKKYILILFGKEADKTFFFSSFTFIEGDSSLSVKNKRNIGLGVINWQRRLNN